MHAYVDACVRGGSILQPTCRRLGASACLDIWSNVKLCVCVCVLFLASLANPAEDRLLNKLLRSHRHNTLTIPVSDVGQTVNVRLGLGVQKIIQVVRSSRWINEKYIRISSISVSVPGLVDRLSHVLCSFVMPNSHRSTWRDNYFLESSQAVWIR